MYKCLRVFKYIKQKLIEVKGESDRSTIIFGDFNILFNN